MIVTWTAILWHCILGYILLYKTFFFLNNFTEENLHAVTLIHIYSSNHSTVLGFFFFFDHSTWHVESYFLPRDWTWAPLQSKYRVLTTGSPAKSSKSFLCCCAKLLPSINILLLECYSCIEIDFGLGGKVDFIWCFLLNYRILENKVIKVINLTYLVYILLDLPF